MESQSFSSEGEYGYYLLSPGWAFTKNGVTKADGYQIQDTASLHAKYESVNKKDCRILGLPKELCGMRAQYFRCSPDNAAPTDLENKVAALEADLHHLYFGESPAGSLEEKKNEIRHRTASLEAEIAAGPATEITWKIDLLRLRLVSACILPF